MRQLTECFYQKKEIKAIEFWECRASAPNIAKTRLTGFEPVTFGFVDRRPSFDKALSRAN
jgi:hypothetical protein